MLLLTLNVLPNDRDMLTLVCELANLGYSDAEIASFFGWSSADAVAPYHRVLNEERRLNPYAKKSWPKSALRYANLFVMPSKSSGHEAVLAVLGRDLGLDTSIIFLEGLQIGIAGSFDPASQAMENLMTGVFGLRPRPAASEPIGCGDVWQSYCQRLVAQGFGTTYPADLAAFRLRLAEFASLAWGELRNGDWTSTSRRDILKIMKSQVAEENDWTMLALHFGVSSVCGPTGYDGLGKMFNLSPVAVAGSIETTLAVLRQCSQADLLRQLSGRTRQSASNHSATAQPAPS